jgi:hypothetical protein
VTIPVYPNVNVLKQAIRTLIRGSHPKVWTQDEFMRALYCERAMLDEALAQLVFEGQLRKAVPNSPASADVVTPW